MSENHDDAGGLDRRKFLAGLLAAGASATLAGCEKSEEPPTTQPEKNPFKITPRPSPTVSLTPYGRGSYHIVYTANTGCGGATGVPGRHNLDNIRTLADSGAVTVDYINTNFRSNEDLFGASTPLDAEGKPVTGTQIAMVARGGNDPSGKSQLGLDLLETYNLGATGSDVVLVYVTNPNDRKTDRIVSRFDSTFEPTFADDVKEAMRRDRLQHQSGKGAER